ncbi:MAG: ABC transporter ATP-binding protein [Pirellulales bacterium]
MIQISNLRYDYGSAGFQLRIDQLSIAAGEKVALIGPSGSGKTTLLHLISGAKPTQQGNIIVDDQQLNSLSDYQRRLFRATKIGFVFQDFELIEYLNVTENIRLPYLINSELRFQAQQELTLEQLTLQTGLSDKLKRFPDQLSQGERQRVAICRALITSPRILLADEPTGSLDPDTAADILQLLLQQATQLGTTLLMVTHDHSLIHQFDRTIDMRTLMTQPNLRSTQQPSAERLP